MGRRREYGNWEDANSEMGMRVKDGERACKLVCENSCDREGDCKGGRIVGGELPEAVERTCELIESKSEIEKGDSVLNIGVREGEES
jgi:hypothetical protein